MSTERGAGQHWRMLLRAIATACFSVVAALPALAQPPQIDDVDPLEHVRDKGVLEVALYEEFPPYSDAGADGKAEGIDVDIASELANRLGVKPKVRLFPAGESASDDLRNEIWKGHYLGYGVADLMLHVGYDVQFAARESRALIFAPYQHEDIVVAYREGAVKNLDSPAALADYKIAVEGESISDLFMTSAFSGIMRGAAIHKRSLSEAVAALKSGEADGVMGPRAELQGLLAEQKLDRIVLHKQSMVGMYRTDWDLGMAVRNGGRNSLRDALAQAMQALIKDGSLKRIYGAHGVDYAAPPAEVLDARP